MSAAGYILAINLLVAGLFAGAFLWIALHDRTQVPARWFVASFVLGMMNFVAEAMVPLVPIPRLAVFSAFSLALAALGVFAIGVARHYRVVPPWRMLAALVVVSLPLNLAIYDMERGSFWRVLLYQLPYFAVQAIAAWVILQAQGRRTIDWVLFGLIAASALHFLGKAPLASVFGAGATARDYVDSVYALISQSMGSVLIVAAGLLVMAILVRDLLADATEKSETDQLSGLLNRRGFEARVDEAVDIMARTRIPASIVLCDLDRFKDINDSFGHAAGDRVIAHFAAILRSSVSDGHVAGRIGGEEFAVLLPGANLASARLFAEAVRTAFAEETVDGLATERRFTASFGVAALEPGDTMSTMLRRADRALYDAKRDGRDCVRTASPAEMREYPASRRAL